MIENCLNWLIIVTAICLISKSGSFDQDFTNPASSNIDFENFRLAELAKKIEEASALEEELNETDAISSLGNILLNLKSESSVSGNDGNITAVSDLAYNPLVTDSPENAFNNAKLNEGSQEALKETNKNLSENINDISNSVSLEETSEHPEPCKVLDKREAGNDERPIDINATVQASETFASDVLSGKFELPINDNSIIQGPNAGLALKSTTQNLDSSRKFRDINEKSQFVPSSLFMKNPPMIVSSTKSRYGSREVGMEKVAPSSSSFIDLGCEHEDDDAIKTFQNLITLIDIIIQTAGSNVRKDLGLFRKSTVNDAAFLLTNDEDKMEKAVVQIVSCIKDALKDQISSKCCIPLPTELHSFLIWLTHGLEGGAICPPTLITSKSKPSYLFHEDNHRPHIANPFLGTPPSPSEKLEELIPNNQGQLPRSGIPVPQGLQEYPEPNFVPQYTAESNQNGPRDQYLGDQSRNDILFKKKIALSNKNVYRPLRSLPEGNYEYSVNDNHISDQFKEKTRYSNEDTITYSEESEPYIANASDNYDQLKNQVEWREPKFTSDNNLIFQEKTGKSISKRDLSSRRKHGMTKYPEDYLDDKSIERKKKRRNGMVKLREKLNSRDQQETEYPYKTSIDLQTLHQSDSWEDDKDSFPKDRKEIRREKKKNKCVKQTNVDMTDESYNVNLSLNSNTEKKARIDFEKDEYQPMKSFDLSDDSLSSSYEESEINSDHDSGITVDINTQENKPKKKKKQNSKERQMQIFSTETKKKNSSKMNMSELSLCAAADMSKPNERSDSCPSGRTFRVSLSCRKNKINQLKPSILFEDDLASETNEKDIYVEPDYNFNDFVAYEEDEYEPDLDYESSKTSSENKCEGISNNVVRSKISSNSNAQGLLKQYRLVKKKPANRNNLQVKTHHDSTQSDSSQSGIYTTETSMSFVSTSNAHLGDNQVLTPSTVNLISVSTNTSDCKKMEEESENLKERKLPIESTDNNKVVKKINKDNTTNKNQDLERKLDDKIDKLEKKNVYNTQLDDRMNSVGGKMSGEKPTKSNTNEEEKQSDFATDKVGNHDIRNIEMQKHESDELQNLKHNLNKEKKKKEYSSQYEGKQNKYEKTAEEKQEGTYNIAEDKPMKKLDTKIEDKYEKLVEDKLSKQSDSKLQDKYNTLNAKAEENNDLADEDNKNKKIDSKTHEKYDIAVKDNQSKNTNTKIEEKYEMATIEDQQNKKLHALIKGKENKEKRLNDQNRDNNNEEKQRKKYSNESKEEKVKNIETTSKKELENGDANEKESTENEKIDPMQYRNYLIVSSSSPGINNDDGNMNLEEEGRKEKRITNQNAESEAELNKKFEPSSNKQNKLSIARKENIIFNTDKTDLKETSERSTTDDEENILKISSKEKHNKLDPKKNYAVSFDKIRGMDKTHKMGKCHSKDGVKKRFYRKNGIKIKRKIKKKANNIVIKQRGLNLDKSNRDDSKNLNHKVEMNKKKSQSALSKDDKIISKVVNKKNKNVEYDENEKEEIEDIKRREELHDEIGEDSYREKKFVNKKSNNRIWIDEDRRMDDLQSLSNIDGSSNSDIQVDNFIIQKPIRANNLPWTKESFLRLILPMSLQYSNSNLCQEKDDALLNVTNILKGIGTTGENIKSNTDKLIRNTKIGEDLETVKQDQLAYDEYLEIEHTESTMVKLSTLSTSPRTQEITSVRHEPITTSKPRPKI